VTTLKPCNNCAERFDCQKRRDVQKGIRGMGLTSVQFRCEILFAKFPPGTRISADIRMLHELEGPLDSGESITTMEGTVLSWHSKKRAFKVQMDEEITFDPYATPPKVGHIITLWPRRMNLLSENPRRLCEGGYANCETAGFCRRCDDPRDGR